jgi:hypothetical protein
MDKMAVIIDIKDNPDIEIKLPNGSVLALEYRFGGVGKDVSVFILGKYGLKIGEKIGRGVEIIIPSNLK